GRARASHRRPSPAGPRRSRRARSRGRLGDVSARHVRAGRILGEGVAVHPEGARARSATDLPELARAALAAELVGIAELSEERVVAVDARDALVPHVAAGDGQEAARRDLTDVRDEADALPVVDAPRRAADPVGDAA